MFVVDVGCKEGRGATITDGKCVRQDEGQK